MFTATSTLLAINEHTMQLERAISECKREYKLLLDAIMYSQKGILQLHIISPAQIVQQMKESRADIPSELSLLIPLSAAYQNLVLHIIDFDVYRICDSFTLNKPCDL
jgi:hypothetical protein